MACASPAPGDAFSAHRSRSASYSPLSVGTWPSMVAAGAGMSHSALPGRCKQLVAASGIEADAIVLDPNDDLVVLLDINSTVLTDASQKDDRRRGCVGRAATHCGILSSRGNEPHPEPRAHASLPGGVPATLRHGARSVARMPTAAQRANWTVGLGTTPMSLGHCHSCSHCLNCGESTNFVYVSLLAKLSLVNS